MPVGSPMRRRPVPNVERRLSLIEIGLNTHLNECTNQNKVVEKRLWRVEWLIIASASAMIGLLCKLAFFSA